MATQIKADLRDILDFHHREHHNDWLTVVETVTTSAGTRLVCLCSHGYNVYADSDRVIKTREVPTSHRQKGSTSESSVHSLLRRVIRRVK
jgi:hypothetical protein